VSAVPTSSQEDRVLIVDDDDQVRRVLGRILERGGYAPAAAANVEEARWCLSQRCFGVLIADVEMPGESGIDLVREVVARRHPTAALMISGLHDPGVAQAAIEEGAYGYLTKPFREADVTIAVSNALHRRRLEIENREHQARLEERIAERTSALRDELARRDQWAARLRAAHEETIHRLSQACEFRDNETGRHIERMSRYSELLAARAGFDAERCRLVRMASSLHDAGKIAIPDHVLYKQGPLGPDEWEVMKAHAEIGRQLLSGSSSDVLDLAATIAWTHHERYDGKGYPRGLRGEAIPIEGRIAAIADVFDALTCDRVYRKALSTEDAVATMLEGRGTQFDPDLLDSFLASMDEVLEIRDGASPLGRSQDDPRLRASRTADSSVSSVNGLSRSATSESDSPRRSIASRG